jgi:hypothetical protein
VRERTTLRHMRVGHSVAFSNPSATNRFLSAGTMIICEETYIFSKTS